MHGKTMVMSIVGNSIVYSYMISDQACIVAGWTPNVQPALLNNAYVIQIHKFGMKPSE